MDDAGERADRRQGWRVEGLVWRSALAAYDLLTAVAVAAVLGPFELLLRRLGRAAPGDLEERLGRGGVAARGAGSAGGLRVLVHAVSVGEMRAATALVRALVEEEPAVEVILSAGNRAGRAAASRFGASCEQVRAVQLLPWDRRAAVRGWLEALRPDAVVVAETEIWPLLFVTCKEMGIPLALASGRLRPRDVARYRLGRGFFRLVLQCADWIAVQGEADRLRFLRIGAPAERLRIMGDLKMGAAAAGAGRYGSRPGRREEEVLRSWQEALGGERPLLVAGSTHAPEERWLLSALAELRGGAPGGPRLLLAPRRPERAAALCRMARRRGLSAHRFSAGPRNGWDVLVLDEMGWLAALYGAGALAFVGGTLARRGGHTPIEAAAHGLPLLAGPHREHIAELAGDLERAGGLLGVRSTRGLASAWRALLADPAERLRMGAAARAVVTDGEVIAARYARAVLAVAAGRAPAAPAVGTPSTELTALGSPRSVRSVEHPG